MYQFSYAEMVEDAAESGRELERRALARAGELLALARVEGPSSQASVEAVYFVRRLWTHLIEDLARAENDLPEKLRADLISIGLWILRELDHIRMGRSTNFDGVIEINDIIREGLK
jgi:flagellar biosynthesis activator protein FlaF